MWIIFGETNKRIFPWPILQVTSTIVKLFCPMEKHPRISTDICPSEPSASDKKMDVLALVQLLPQMYTKGGKAVGISIETIELLASWIDFKPEFHLIYKDFDTLFQDLSERKGDLGVATAITHQRFHMVDFTSVEEMSQMVYVVPKPKPIDVFYQFVTPFQPVVWFVTSGFVLIFWILIIFIIKFIEFKSKIFDSNDMKNDCKSFHIQTVVDYFICCLSVVIAPLLNDLKWFVSVFKYSLAGKITLTTLAIYGFLIPTFYKNILLSHLTAVGYEKEIETVQGINSKS